MASPIGTARMPTQGSWRPLVDDLGLVAVAVDGLARRQDRRGRLDGKARDDRLAGRDAAEDAAGVVGQEHAACRHCPCASRRRCPRRESAAAAKPSPISTPLTALMPISAPARSRVELAIDRRAEARPARLRRPPRSPRRPTSRPCGRRRDSRSKNLRLLGVGAEERIVARPRPSPSARGRSCAGPSAPARRARSCPARSCARWRRPRPAPRSRAPRRGRRRDNRGCRIWRRRCSRRGRAGTCP